MNKKIVIIHISLTFVSSLFLSGCVLSQPLAPWSATTTQIVEYTNAPPNLIITEEATTTPGLYSNPSAGISFTYPTSWVYLESGDTYGYSIKFASSPYILNSSSLPETGASLMIGTRYATTNDIPFTINTNSMVDVVDWIATADNANLDGGENLRTFWMSGYPAASGIYTAANDTGAPTTVYITAVLRNDNIIAFFSICPQAEWSQYQSIFDSIVNSINIVTP
jgi:hypothetical protein